MRSGKQFHNQTISSRPSAGERASHEKYISWSLPEENGRTCASVRAVK